MFQGTFEDPGCSINSRFDQLTRLDCIEVEWRGRVQNSVHALYSAIKRVWLKGPVSATSFRAIKAIDARSPAQCRRR